MTPALLGSSAARPRFPLEANRGAVIAALAVMAFAVTSSSCREPRRGPAQELRDGWVASDGASSGGGTGSSSGLSSGGAAGGSSRGSGTGGAGGTDGSGGTGVTGVGTGGAPDGSGGASPNDAGLSDATAASDAALPGTLAIAPSSIHEFGQIEVGNTSSPTTFTITNTGDTATGVLGLTNDNPTEMAPSGCGSSLAGHGSCTLAVTFTPRKGGHRTTTLILSGSPGGALVITLAGTGAYRLTVVSTGSGTVTSSPTGLTCNGSSCTGLFPGAVNLHSVPGPDQLFAGWSGGGCPAGVVRDCSLTAADTSVSLSFVPQTDNLAFVTSAAVPATLGATSNYDKHCNDAATAAGINNSAGDAFVALVSSSASDVAARIGNARGWQRLDGRPVIDTLAAALTTKDVFNAIMFNEKGATATNQFVKTGIGADGRASPTNNCAEFTASTGTLVGGFSDGGAYSWSTGVVSMCSYNSPLACLGKTRSRTVKPTVTAGKRIWVTSTTFGAGAGTTPDAACQASRPSGVTMAAAFISTQTRPATAILSPTTLYVRPDGVLVGLGTAIGAGTIESGIWQHADGSYVDGAFAAWTGSARPDSVGTSESTCMDWTGTAGSTTFGASVGTVGQISKFWYQGGTSCTSVVAHLYCVQTAP